MLCILFTRFYKFFREVGTIVRSLKCCPTEGELHDILADVIFSISLTMCLCHFKRYHPPPGLTLPPALPSRSPPPPPTSPHGLTLPSWSPLPLTHPPLMVPPPPTAPLPSWSPHSPPPLTVSPSLLPSWSHPCLVILVFITIQMNPPSAEDLKFPKLLNVPFLYRVGRDTI